MKATGVKHVLAVLALAASSFAAQAGYIGNSVQATACFPDLGAGCTTTATKTAVVGAGIEFADGDFTPFFGPSFDFANTTITITHAQTGHQPGTFNGYDFFDVNSTMPDIIGVSILTDNTGFFSSQPGRVFFNANHVFVNFESLSFAGTNAPEIVLGVAFAPEPATLALVGLALLGVGAARRRAR